MHLPATTACQGGWRERYGSLNEHTGWVPRDFWLEDWEKREIIAFHLKNPREGYRRLTFMMLDANIVAVSPASVWRVLSRAGLLQKWNGKPSKKGTGFDQPPQPHQLRHQFGQRLILRLDLLLQIRDSFLFGLMVGSASPLENRGSVLEELLLPAVEHRRVEL